MGLLVWRGPTNALVMAPTSPKLQYTDRVRATDIYMGAQSVCVANMLARGTFGTGFRTGWVVNQCTVDTQRGTIGTLTYEWEAGGSSATQPLPIGTPSLKPQELYPKIERNGIFAGIDATTISIVYNALYLATNAQGQVLGGDQFLTAKIINGGPDGQGHYTSGTAATQLALAQNLLSKMMIGEETYYLAGWRYTYEVYSYTAPTVGPGGIIGTPGGPYAGILPGNVSWLRLADDLDPAGVHGSMYKLNVTWLGGPNGHWDSDIYSAYQ